MTHPLLYPWKLVTLLIGIVLLVIGAFYYNAPDWDIGISIIMALCTYVTAPWTIRCIMNRKNLLAALAAAWFSIDGCYWIYWSVMNPDALTMRDANAACSTFLYFMMGMFWLYNGSLRSLIEGTLDAFPRSLKSTDKL